APPAGRLSLLFGHCWHDYLLFEVSGQRGDGQRLCGRRPRRSAALKTYRPSYLVYGYLGKPCGSHHVRQGPWRMQAPRSPGIAFRRVEAHDLTDGVPEGGEWRAGLDTGPYGQTHSATGS
ncbi:MAG: hypothetical protein ACLPYW_15995, partial [Acidimicrobiales bacterium]